MQVTLLDEKPGTAVCRERYFDNPNQLVEAFQETRDPSRHLALLLQACDALSRTMELDKLLPKILDLIFEVAPADRGTILMTSSDGQLQPAFAKHRNQTQSGTSINASRTILAEVLSKKEGVLTRDAMHDSRFDASLSIMQEDIHSALCVPLVGKLGDVLGAIYVDAVSAHSPFDTDHLKLATGIAMQATLAIENAMLLRQISEKERMQHELKIAGEIQMNLVPKESASVPGLETSGLIIPATEVGGDYYDLILSSDHQRLYVAIGDVMGKGVPAGLVMMMACTFLRTVT
jgi:transcriptional regulator with GAF, ATPase, and Fis domain